MTKKEKLYIRAFAFISSIIILIASLFYNGLNVLAYNGVVANDSTYLLKDVAGIPDTFYDSSAYNNLVGYNSDLSSVYSSCLSQGLPFQFYSSNNGATYEQYFSNGSGFVTFGYDENLSSLYVLLGSSGSVVCTDQLGNTYLCYSDFDSLPDHPNWTIPSILSLAWGTNGGNAINDLQRNTFRMQLDGVDYLAIPMTKYIINSSFDIYYVDSAVTQTGSYSSSSVIPSPMPSNTSETAKNNLYLSNSNFDFQNTKFVAPYSSVINTGGIYPNGSITFSGIPNQYQVEHKEEFVLTFGFQFRYNVIYQNQGQTDFGPFKRTNALLNSKKKYSNQLHYSNNGVESITIPLSQFISNGNSVSWTMQDILSHMVGEYDYETLLSQSKELTSVEYNAFDIVCTAYISSGVDSSGEYSEWYNPMSNKGYTTSENMKINDNPYTPSADNQGDQDYYGELDAPGVAGNNNSGSGSGSGNSSASANPHITINNNPTFNNDVNSNGGSGSGSGSGAGSSEEAGLAFNFYNTFSPFKLIFNRLSDDKEAVSDETIEDMGVNSFISFLSNTFSFLPLTFWDKFTWYIGACLGILIVAVVLRVILDLL